MAPRRGKEPVRGFYQPSWMIRNLSKKIPDEVLAQTICQCDGLSYRLDTVICLGNE